MSGLHWTYKRQPSDDLEQGDLLKVSEYLKSILQKYHPYYASHPDNQFYLVLSQSCDLVRRNDSCKSEYLAIAPVRPLQAILDREFADVIIQFDQSSEAIASKSTQAKYRDTLTKIFNNNYPKYFFLHAQSDRGLAQDMCAVLPLSISIKSEHYDECIKARFLSLDDAFQAKLGYLIGQQYSKVGTRDWDANSLDGKVQKILDQAAVWVNDSDMPELRRHIEERKAANAADVIDAQAIQGILAQLPSRKDQAIMVIMEFLAGQGLTTKERSKERGKLRKALENDPEFARLFRG